MSRADGGGTVTDQEKKPNETAQAAEASVNEKDSSAQGNGAQPDIQAEIDAVRAELEEARQLELRALADLDNYRKRVSRQMEDERRYACVPFVRDLLPVLDNLQRTIEAAETAPDAASLLEGVKLVVKQFYTALERQHVEPIQALHQPFDPNVHEAVLQQPSDQLPPNTVMQEVQTGFKVFDRVVRPTKVIVSRAAE